MSEHLNQVGEGLTRLYLEARSRLAEERGQTAAEYLGIVVVVAAIVGALATMGPDIGDATGGFIQDQIESIGGGG